MPKRTDANQAEIVDALRRCGVSIADLHALGHGIPDLVAGASLPCPFCGRRYPQNLLVEIKGSKGTLTPDEQRFHSEWRGSVVIVRSIADALQLLGVE